MSVEQKVSRPEQPLNRFEYCASGRRKTDVMAELGRAQQRASVIDKQIHKQRVEICRKEWDAKYKGEYPFNPDAAYTSLVPGERLDQDLCREFYELHQMIFLLNEELAEPHAKV